MGIPRGHFSSDSGAVAWLRVQKTGYHYLKLRPFAALARPLARVPLTPPRAVPPRPDGPIPPRLALPILDAGAGVENFGVGFEEAGGFSTNDVSVVLKTTVKVRHES